MYVVGSKENGNSHFWLKMDKIMGGLKLWKTYFMLSPKVVVTGGKRCKAILSQEFQENGVAALAGENILMGNQHMLAVKDGSLHAFYRRLVGSAMTPAACNAAVPNFQALAQKKAEEMLQSPASTNMEDICTEFTLDVAWGQILGLDLEEEEVKVFYDMVNKWVAGIVNLRILFGLFPKQTEAYKARSYIVHKIEEKIDDLLKNGPDTTTMSGLVFATDEEDSSQKLSRQQIVDNVLLPILAGTETSASTLTNAMLCLGLHRSCWEKLVEEQRQIQANHGDGLEREILEKECPYLEAVIKETMRLKPLPSGAPRKLKATQIIDGYQIPKGWQFFWNIFLTHAQDPITYKEDGSHMDIKEGFIPERWLDKKTRPSDDFIPMGGGPRYCLGATLAYTEMKVFLAVLARKLDFKLANPQEVIVMKRMSILPKPADGVPVTSKPR
jgi:cytochrome P450